VWTFVVINWGRARFVARSGRWQDAAAETFTIVSVGNRLESGAHAQRNFRRG
jgi:hypothetical protein